MSKKRKRDHDEKSLALVDVYNDLADENEATRFKAAQTLLEKFSDPASTTQEQISAALKRLIRGLCSSRKAARIGFSITLTEFLSQVSAFPAAQKGLDVFEVVQVLESQTSPSESVSRQDEREHYFGRLFGAEALLKSEIFFKAESAGALDQLLGLICALATKKPWLRKECGWVLYSSIFSSSAVDATVAEKTLNALLEQKLIRTPEGVAIWLGVREHFPKAKFPKDVWKNDDPLYKKEKALLAKVMRDATPRNDDEDKSPQAQGGAMWNAQLHFAWATVLQQLYSNTDEDGQLKNSKLISFEQFWTEVVDGSLFAPESSSERKHTGFLVCTAALTSAPAPLLQFILRGNVLRTLINQLASGERLLHRAAKRMIQTLVSRGGDSAPASVSLVKAILYGTEGSSSFDQVTKTKTLEKLVTNAKAEALEEMTNVISAFIQKPGNMDEKQAQSKRQSAADLLVLVFGQSLGAEVPKPVAEKTQRGILSTFVACSYFISTGSSGTVISPPLTSSSRQVMQTRLSNCLERAMRIQTTTSSSLDITVSEIRRLEKTKKEWKLALEMDSEVRSAVDVAWIALDTVQKKKSSLSPFLQALKLLFLLSILQVYNGEPEAVHILEELESYAQDATGDSTNSSDGIVEILLSFSSQPSKFLRRIVSLVFQIFAPSLTATGLQSLTRILEADESIRGQQELFEEQPSGEDDEDEDSHEEDGSELDSDVEMLDSDVEAVSASEEEDGSESEDDEDEDSDASEGEEDDELAAFEAKLAAALGTRKGEDDLDASDTSGSDQDMDDDEMEALDEQLASVFRARNDETNKKKEKKDAKGNIVQFKNRVLELLEVYVKQEFQNPLSLTLVLPLLSTARKTKTKQIADRSNQLIRELCAKCKGKNLPAWTDSAQAIELLGLIHEEASYQSSQAHANASSQASILVVKVLVAADPANVEAAVDAYALLRKKQLMDQKCHVSPSFFTEWNNWCSSFRQQLKK